MSASIMCKQSLLYFKEDFFFQHIPEVARRKCWSEDHENSIPDQRDEAMRDNALVAGPIFAVIALSFFPASLGR